jgi:hypothetical protein
LVARVSQSSPIGFAGYELHYCAEALCREEAWGCYRYCPMIVGGNSGIGAGVAFCSGGSSRISRASSSNLFCSGFRAWTPCQGWAHQRLSTKNTNLSQNITRTSPFHSSASSTYFCFARLNSTTLLYITTPLYDGMIQRS